MIRPSVNAFAHREQGESEIRRDCHGLGENTEDWVHGTVVGKQSGKVAGLSKGGCILTMCAAKGRKAIGNNNNVSTVRYERVYINNE